MENVEHLKFIFRAKEILEEKNSKRLFRLTFEEIEN